MKHSKNKYKDIEDFFAANYTPNEKAWSIIIDFYDKILKEIKRRKIKRSYIAKKLGVSDAAVSKLLNNTPNITLKKMVELADSIGMDINLSLESTVVEEEIQSETFEWVIESKDKYIKFPHSKPIPFSTIAQSHTDKDTAINTVCEQQACYGGS